MRCFPILVAGAIAAGVFASNAAAVSFTSGQMFVTGSSQFDINGNGGIDDGESNNANAAFPVQAGARTISGSGGTSTGGVSATLSFASAIQEQIADGGPRTLTITFNANVTALCPPNGGPSAFAALTCTSNLDNLPIVLNFDGTDPYTYSMTEIRRENVNSFALVDAVTRNALPATGTFNPGSFAFDYSSNVNVSSSSPGDQSIMEWSMTVTQLPSPAHLPLVAFPLMGMLRKRHG